MSGRNLPSDFLRGFDVNEEWRRLANETIMANSAMRSLFAQVDRELDATNIPKIDTQAYEFNLANSDLAKELLGTDLHNTTVYGISLDDILKGMYGSKSPKAQPLDPENAEKIAEAVKKVKPVSVQ